MIVHLGDGNDLAESNNDHAAGHSVQFYGEDGDDDLQSQGSADLLDGGPGNDRLEPDDEDAGSGDIVVGGPGHRLAVARLRVRRQRADHGVLRRRRQRRLRR